MPRQNITIPKFGEWEAQSGVAYSTLFETARKEKGRISITSQKPEDGKPTGSHGTHNRKSIESDDQRFSFENASSSGYGRNEIKMNGSPDQQIRMAMSQEAKHKEKSMQIAKPRRRRSQSITEIQDDDNTSVPKFGDWNFERSTGKNYSVIFDRASQEKKSRSGENAAHKSISPLYHKGALSMSSEGSRRSENGKVNIFFTSSFSVG